MKVKRVLYILSVTLLVACSSGNDEQTPTGRGQRVPLEIVASIDVQAEAATRAAETAWEADDKIGVYMVTDNSGTIYIDEDETPGKNMPYTFNDGTNYETYGTTSRLFSPNSKKIYLSDENVDVYGYYPYAATKSDGTDLAPTAIEINVSDQTSQKALDLMRARTGNVNNERASIELLFQHRLSKLVFNLKQGEGMLEDELKDASYLGMVLKNQYTKATYNIYTDEFSSPAELQDIIPVRATSAPTGYVRSYEAIVLPNVAGNTAADRTVSITFYRKTKDQITNTFKIPGSTYFDPGTKYVFNVTVNATTITVDPTKYTEQW